MKSKKRQGRRRHVPQRTCVGCRTTRPKRDMIRIVRTPAGELEIDPKGKQPGRGAYLCRRKGCWETALKRRSLDRALKTKLDKDIQDRLVAYAQALPEISETG